MLFGAFMVRAAMHGQQARHGEHARGKRGGHFPEGCRYRPVAQLRSSGGMDTPVYSWKQQGIIRLWRYTQYKRKFGGWHLTADARGAESLASLLALLHASPGSFRTVTITAPSPRVLRVPNFQQGRALWVAPGKWRVRSSPAADAWSFPDGLDPAELTFGAGRFPDLLAAIRGIPRGEGDFSIGGSCDSALHFWWHPNVA